MAAIKVLQIGLGPLGLKVANFIAERKGLKTVAAVDENPDLVGMDLAKAYGAPAEGVVIHGSIEEALQENPVDVAILTTYSDIERITPQIESIVSLGIPVVSTCKELSYPWVAASQLSERIDKAAKANGVAVVGTGVNPGFLMDALPIFLTTACQQVESIEINRFQNASHRRIPFQKTIGVGLSLEDFEKQRREGKIKHIGLVESMQHIADRMGWVLDHTEDIVNPVLAEEDLITPSIAIEKGQVLGVSQIGRAYSEDHLRITLIFQAILEGAESYDEIIIKGEPNIRSRIENGVDGDIATAAVLINTIPRILQATPGLKTMTDLSLTSFFQ